MTTGREAGMLLGSSYLLIQRQQAERVTLDLAWALETSNPIPSHTPIPTRSHLLILPNSPPNWEANIYEPMGGAISLIPPQAGVAQASTVSRPCCSCPVLKGDL